MNNDFYFVIDYYYLKLRLYNCNRGSETVLQVVVPGSPLHACHVTGKLGPA